MQHLILFFWGLLGGRGAVSQPHSARLQQERRMMETIGKKVALWPWLSVSGASVPHL